MVSPVSGKGLTIERDPTLYKKVLKCQNPLGYKWRRFDVGEADAKWAGHKGELLSIEMVPSGWKTAPWRHSQSLPRSGVMDRRWFLEVFLK